MTWTPPRKLCVRAGDKHYHPSWPNVGVRVNGVERRDVLAYDMDTGEVEYVGRRREIATTIEPYSRAVENRQQKRARERWEKKHGRS